MKKLVTLVAVLLLSASSFAQTEWKADPNHSSLNFTIEHFGINMVNGKFMDYTGKLTTNGDDLSDADFNFTVKIESINTNVDKRDNHLKSAEFFEAKKYPEMTFKSTKISASDKPDNYKLYGKLTIKDVTKDVVFDVHYGGKMKNDKGERLGLKATTTINRFDYNVDYDPSGTTVGKKVNIVAHLEFIKQ